MGKPSHSNTHKQQQPEVRADTEGTHMESGPAKKEQPDEHNNSAISNHTSTVALVAGVENNSARSVQSTPTVADRDTLAIPHVRTTQPKVPVVLVVTRTR